MRPIISAFFHISSFSTHSEVHFLTIFFFYFSIFLFSLELIDNEHISHQNFIGFDKDSSRIVNNPKMDIETIPDNSFYSLNEWQGINHHNVTASGTTMEAYRNNNIDNIFPLQKPRTNTRLEMAISSQILIMAGTYSYLYFDITNIDKVEILYNIQVSDEKRYLISLSTQR